MSRFTHFLEIFGQKKGLFGSKTVFLGQEVHYYMVYIAYFTELILQICDYAQKRRIWRENCKYALHKNFHCHFCSRRKAAKFCHPGLQFKLLAFWRKETPFIDQKYTYEKVKKIRQGPPPQLDSFFSLENVPYITIIILLSSIKTTWVIPSPGKSCVILTIIFWTFNNPY